MPRVLAVQQHSLNDLRRSHAGVSTRAHVHSYMHAVRERRYAVAPVRLAVPAFCAVLSKPSVLCAVRSLPRGVFDIGGQPAQHRLALSTCHPLKSTSHSLGPEASHATQHPASRAAPLCKCLWTVLTACAVFEQLLPSSLYCLSMCPIVSLAVLACSRLNLPSTNGVMDVKRAQQLI